MQRCELCNGRGVLLEPARLCECIIHELGTLRAVLVGQRLLPPAHWIRMLLPGPGSVRERSISIRSDGYRVKLAADGMIVALNPAGELLKDEGTDRALWWGRLEDAERTIDKLRPLEPTT